MKSAGKRPVIGLALGSGSARGLAHFGVIRALKEFSIPVDVIAGTSMGALVGAAYASGRVEKLEEAFREFDWRTIGSLFDPVFPRSGLISGKKITEFVRTHVSAERVEGLPIPFCAIAADITSGEEIRMDHGDILEVVRASISVPGILTPVPRDGRILVDGGLVDPVPVSAVRAMGADLVIAVDLNHEIVTGRPLRKRMRRPGVQQAIASRFGRTRSTQAAARIMERLRAGKRVSGVRLRTRKHEEPLPGMVELLLASLHVMQVRLTESRLSVERPEVLIRPPLGPIHLLEFDRAEEVIAVGYRSALNPVRDLARKLRR